MEAFAAPARETAHSAPHAPEAGWVRRLLGPFYVTGIFWYRFHSWGVRFLPSWGIYLLMPLFVGFFFLSLRNIRAAIAANLVPILGSCGWLERQLRMFRTLWIFSWCLTERYERLNTDRKFQMAGDGMEQWQVLLASGRGFIVATAHIGNWEIGSMFSAADDEQRRVHVVREAEGDPRAQRFISDLIRRAARGNYITHFAEDPQLGVTLLDALRQGDIVALQGDRPRSGGRIVEAELFGEAFPLPVGPAALARAAEVPILPVFIFREARLRYRCAMRPPIQVARTSNRQADVEEAVLKLAAELQWAIGHRPHQWFCFRKLWAGRRPKESALGGDVCADRAA
ncbi:MAG TPA: lysophospholipid acyltransferase family protein [Thermoanaerobaculia bacterium]|nr:lysophospholipid acyltransferase family protein [Thermoanaerobaculia bacterium]